MEFLYSLTELHSVYTSMLGEFGVEKNVHKKRLKLQITKTCLRKQ